MSPKIGGNGAKTRPFSSQKDSSPFIPPLMAKTLSSEFSLHPRGRLREGLGPVLFHARERVLTNNADVTLSPPQQLSGNLRTNKNTTDG